MSKMHLELEGGDKGGILEMAQGAYPAQSWSKFVTRWSPKTHQE